MQRRNKRAKERNVHACPTLRKTFPQTFFHQPERVEEEGGGGFYTILALPHARLPFPLLVNELSKHRVFVVRANGSMRGTEPVSASGTEERRAESKSNILYFASFQGWLIFVFLVLFFPRRVGGDIF